MPSISLVVPAYNEEAGLESTINRCIHTLRLCTDDYEIIILDDCSADRTAEIMERIRQKDPLHIKTIRHPVNMGIAATFEDLYKAASKEYLFLTPGDGEYPPEALIDCVKQIPEKDIVICHRITKNYTPYRQLISQGYRWFTALFFGVDLYDPGSVKLIRKSIITDIPVTSKSVYVEAERIIRAARMGYKIGKVDIIQESRKGGRARGAKFKTVRLAAQDMVKLWWELIVRKKT